MTKLVAYMSKEKFFALPSAEQKKKAKESEVYQNYLKEGKGGNKAPAKPVHDGSKKLAKPKIRITKDVVKDVLEKNFKNSEVKYLEDNGVIDDLAKGKFDYENDDMRGYPQKFKDAVKNAYGHLKNTKRNLKHLENKVMEANDYRNDLEERYNAATDKNEKLKLKKEYDEAVKNQQMLDHKHFNGEKEYNKNLSKEILKELGFI